MLGVVGSLLSVEKNGLLPFWSLLAATYHSVSCGNSVDGRHLVNLQYLPYVALRSKLVLYKPQDLSPSMHSLLCTVAPSRTGMIPVCSVFMCPLKYRKGTGCLSVFASVLFNRLKWESQRRQIYGNSFALFVAMLSTTSVSDILKQQVTFCTAEAAFCRN
jgi:hypothetical protein